MLRRQHGPPIAGHPWSFAGNDVEAVRAASSVTSSVLAGFSLTAIMSLTTTDHRPWLWGYALLAFGVATTASLLALNYQQWALRYWADPEDLVTWRPRARVSYAAFDHTRRVQRNKMLVFVSVAAKAEKAGRVAAVAFLSGLGLVLVPAVPDVGWPALRVATLAVIAIGLALFLLTGYLPPRRLGSVLIAPQLYVGGELPSCEAPTDDDIIAVARDADAAERLIRERDATTGRPGGEH
jgi:hypothetical protein